MPQPQLEIRWQTDSCEVRDRRLEQLHSARRPVARQLPRNGRSDDGSMTWAVIGNSTVVMR